VGDVGVGGDNPIRVQSMTTPATTDTVATVDQIGRLVDAGCEIVRVTVPSSADARNLPDIRRELRARGIRVPLVADIHFTPAAAMMAAEHVEKVRINPGNFADKKKFAVREYTDTEYEAELDRIEKTFTPLVLRCRELGVSMRIGTNHGSLSDRILNRFGDTPDGMVESALEFVRICERHDYRDLILSMKASNPIVVLQAYRLLAVRMDEEGMDYPLHLGVTEAGDGEDARIKSAIGIGALLEDGLGDTIRVSLTEDPVAEIPVARDLVEPYNRRLASKPPAVPEETRSIGTVPPPGYERRASSEVSVGPRRIGGSNPVLVEVPLAGAAAEGDAIRRELDSQAGVRVPEETRAELVSITLSRAEEIADVERLRRSMELVSPGVALSGRVSEALDSLTAENLERLARAVHRLHVRLIGPPGDSERAWLRRALLAARGAGAALLVEGSSARGAMSEAVETAVGAARLARESAFDRLLLTVDPAGVESPLHAMRLLAARLKDEGAETPVVLLDRPEDRSAHALLGPSLALGDLLCEGIGDSILIETGSADDSRRLAFGILQAARVRITRTDFISCPSCGRTLFDLEETTARIKSKTAHLKGLKIAVMGCIVNGPGEMADADFGYVGWGEDKIALFVGNEMVEKDIPTADADQRLIDLIKEHGRWVDPPVPATEEG
jgi:(E)-4-hydroxy-3-methylbut-2-enyl-diphosphate synthase